MHNKKNPANSRDRREFLKKSAILIGGSATVHTLNSFLNINKSQAQPNKKTRLNLHTEYITYPGETGDITAYLARPDGEDILPCVIVIHENRGLQPHIEDVARRIAEQGYIAIAPDALSPVGGTPDDENQARTLIGQLEEQSTIQNFVAAVNYLKTEPRSTGKVGCTGFCWGGGMTNQVAVNSPDLVAGVPFYGSQPDSADVPKIKASLLLHYGALDSRINAGIPAFEAALKAASIDYTIYIYEGANHAFFNDTNPDRYHKEAAELAWQRTIAFFNEKLEGGSSFVSSPKSAPSSIANNLEIRGIYPNPFNASTKIKFSLDLRGFVTVDILNISGQRVITLLVENLDRGSYTIRWNGKNAKDSPVSSGSYVCRLRMGDVVATRKLNLVK